MFASLDVMVQSISVLEELKLFRFISKDECARIEVDSPRLATSWLALVAVAASLASALVCKGELVAVVVLFAAGGEITMVLLLQLAASCQKWSLLGKSAPEECLSGRCWRSQSLGLMALVSED